MTMNNGQILSQAPDMAEVERAVLALFHPEQPHELRGLPSKRSRLVGLTHLPMLGRAISELTADAIYWTLSPVDPVLGDRAAKDKDVTERLNLLVDVDAVKNVEDPAHHMATEKEKAAALELAQKIGVTLVREFAWPPPIRVDSGNGGQLLFRLAALPNNDVATNLISRFLKALARRFDNEHAKVDTSVFNASRIARVPGTWNRKGPDLTDRPHRMSRLIYVPEPITTLTLGRLEATVEMLEGGASTQVQPANRIVSLPHPSSTSRPDAEERARKYLATIEPAISGSRGHNKTLYAACRVGPGFDLSEETTVRILLEDYSRRCEPPWTEKEIRHKVESAFKKEPNRGFLLNAERHAVGPPGRKPPGLQVDDQDGEVPVNRTELGNSIRLVNLFGQELRYCSQLGYWLVFHSAYWQPDYKNQVWKFGKATIRHLAKEASKMTDDEERKAMLRFAIESEKKRAIQAMIDLAKSDPRIAIVPEDLDRDPYLLNCPNGTLELRTGKLREHRPEDLITKITAVPYRPDAPRERWEKVLDEIQPESELRAYLKRALGYSICGDTGEHCLFLPYGTGRNGKNTILDPIVKILGEYATNCDPKILLRTGKNDHPTGLADLRGRRLVITDEVDEGEELAEALVKRVTGNPTIKARFMRQDFFEFDVTSKIWMPANHKPDIKGRDEGIWSRIRVIPFEITIPVEKRIKNLARILAKEEGEGILAWLVEGYLDWQKLEGLNEPTKVLDAVKEYRLQQDVVAAFIKECCLTWLDHPNRSQFKVRKDELYSAYASWCKENGEKELLSGREFGSEMTSRGFELKHSNSVHYRHGITLSQPSVTPEALK